MKLGILGSTRGTDALHILQSIQDGILKNITIECIVSNRSTSRILDIGKRYNIDALYVNPKNESGALLSKEQYDDKITEILQQYKVDYVLLVGWMRLLSESFVNTWKNRILNIHPSLLPSFEGCMDMNVHRAVIDRGCKVTGATLMFVDQGADTGPIIAQLPVVVKDTDTPDMLKERVQDAEKELFIEYLPLLRDGKIALENNKVLIL